MKKYSAFLWSPVVLQAYKQKLYGPKYIWFIIGWYADDWYKQPGTSCTVEQMQEVLSGHFTTEGVMLSQKHRTSVSGMVSELVTHPRGGVFIPLKLF